MTEDQHKPSGNFQKLMKYFGLLMVLIYLAAGVLLLLPVGGHEFLNRNSRLILGIALIIYGLFRAWRYLRSMKNENPD